LPNYSRSGLKPDRGLIAALLDGTLDGPVARRVGGLTETEPAWAAELALQRRVRALLVCDPLPETVAAAGRVLLRLQASVAAPRPRPLWQRQLSVPLPVAFGTAALVLAMAFGLVHTSARASVGTMSITTVPSGLKQVQIQAPMSDLQQLLRSLESESAGREVIISLPESSQLFFVGEPALLRAADVDRGRFR
jgi:anti-sigma factor RsiW